MTREVPFEKLPAVTKAIVIVAVRAQSSRAMRDLWRHLGVSIGDDMVTREAYDTDMRIAQWVMLRLLAQKASAQAKLQQSARTHRYLLGRVERYSLAYSSAREFQIAHGAALAGIEQQLRRLNADDHRPIVDRVTDLVDCELLRRANNG